MQDHRFISSFFPPGGGGGSIGPFPGQGGPGYPPGPPGSGSFPGFPTPGGGSSQGPQPGQGGGEPPGPPPGNPPQLQSVSAFAVDPGAIRGCLFRYTYLRLNNGEQFWFYPTFVGRHSVAGYRWFIFRWVYFGIDTRRISAFQCV
ncbi:hypothetical protein [Shouchella lehensis]|uniref:Transporter n=2 Tax=Shouchella lehensis TaxID=300825 RepID=A0A060LS83_9BACI|nr:hypothetical protein [Shouchella lehensis]AIC92900.1 hypothetical protein BleG1_0292 [Shouchella lehensis G1]MBG9783294.1 hypothetical protein [Shouchella lehensis]RQW22507.1 hypothetical protein EH196_01465 [Bacillus sp. C1-1]TES49329.1 hypothetical protein E2L03_07605 [Shouchella lehensis]